MWDDGWTVVTKDRQALGAVRAHHPHHRDRQRDPHPALTAGTGATRPGRRHSIGHDHGDQAGLGIDIGGSGIKGAPVDLDKGDFAADRLRIDTPSRSTPDAVAEVVAQIVEHFADDTGDSPDRRHRPRGRHRTAWSAPPPTSTRPGSAPTPRRCSSERARAPGAPWSTTPTPPASPSCTTAPPRTSDGLVMLTTLGTGIGTRPALPTASCAQHRAGPPGDRRPRRRDPRRVQRHGEARTSPGSSGPSACSATTATSRTLLWPDLIVVGGGVSKKADKFLPLLHLRAPIVAGPAAEQGRHHRRGVARRRRRPPLADPREVAATGRAPGGRRPGRPAAPRPARRPLPRTSARTRAAHPAHAGPPRATSHRPSTGAPSRRARRPRRPAWTSSVSPWRPVGC